MTSLTAARVMVAIGAALAALGPVPAEAFSTMAGHADIRTSKPRVVGGQTRGCTLTFCVRTPIVGYRGAFPALMDPQVAYGLKNGHRNAAIDPSLGKIKVALPFVEVPTANTVVPVSVKLDYAKLGLASGMRLYLVTAWPGTGATGPLDRADPQNDHPHVFGTIAATGVGNEFTLP